MGRSDLFSVRVTMRCAAEIKPHEGHDLSTAILVSALGEIDPRPMQIEKKRFTTVGRD